MQSTEDGRGYPHVMTGEQPQAKTARFGPTEPDEKSSVKMEVDHDEHLQDEVGIVLSIKEISGFRPRGDDEMIES